MNIDDSSNLSMTLTSPYPFDPETCEIEPYDETTAHYAEMSPAGMTLYSQRDLQVMSLIARYFEWHRASKLREKLAPIDRGLDMRPGWKMYGASFNASQLAISSNPQRQLLAQDSWIRAADWARQAFESPTECLLGCIFLFYNNTFMKEQPLLHRQNLSYLYSLAMRSRALGRSNPLTMILKLLWTFSNDDIGKEPAITASLANVIANTASTNFNAGYEARQLFILGLQNLGMLGDALDYSDDLIRYAQLHNTSEDMAPLLRALRRKSRIQFARGHLAQAQETAFSILEQWQNNGSPVEFSKEYIVFEDLAKIFRAEGDMFSAWQYFKRAISYSDHSYSDHSYSDHSYSDHSYGADSCNSSRLRERFAELFAEDFQIPRAPQMTPDSAFRNKEDYFAKEQTRW